MPKLLPTLAAMSMVALMGGGCITKTTVDTSNGSGAAGTSLEGSGSLNDADINGDGKIDDDDSGTTADVKTKTIKLNEQNGSKETGSLVLTEDDGKTTAVLTIAGQPAGAKQPAHIHVGSCATIGAVLYPLANVVDGKSETVIGATLSSILSATTALSVNVHKSEAEIGSYVACGDIKS